MRTADLPRRSRIPLAPVFQQPCRVAKIKQSPVLDRITLLQQCLLDFDNQTDTDIYVGVFGQLADLPASCRLGEHDADDATRL